MYVILVWFDLIFNLDDTEGHRSVVKVGDNSNCDRYDSRWCAPPLNGGMNGSHLGNKLKVGKLTRLVAICNGWAGALASERACAWIGQMPAWTTGGQVVCLSCVPSLVVCLCEGSLGRR